MCIPKATYLVNVGDHSILVFPLIFKLFIKAPSITKTLITIYNLFYLCLPSVYLYYWRTVVTFNNVCLILLSILMNFILKLFKRQLLNYILLLENNQLIHFCLCVWKFFFCFCVWNTLFMWQFMTRYFFLLYLISKV